VAVIYLRHPVHGGKVASTDMEAIHDRANGWEDFVPGKPEVPSIFGAPRPIPEGFPSRELLVKAGHETLESIPRNAEELLKISGIGNATALKILDALEE
jgi:hypothetical protein